MSSATRARIHRVAGGLLTAESRRRYIAVARRRVRRAGIRMPRGMAAGRRVRTDGSCSVCLSTHVDSQRVTWVKDERKSFLVQICRECGYIANPDNFNDYTKYKSLNQFPVSARVGTETQPGREFHMAKMGAQILGGRSLDVMIFGPGRSVDYKHVKKLPRVGSVRIGDIVELHDQPDFVNVLEKSDARFDIVVASEVIEHFTDPGNDFPRLFNLLKKRGLLICSTNIYGGGDLNKHNYLYVWGHTSYYSPRAIERLAADNGMHFDFRVPIVAARAGPRKRYVIFTPSADRLPDIARYFGKHAFAPSEL
jgi:RNase P subunit RPR2